MAPPPDHPPAPHSRSSDPQGPGVDRRRFLTFLVAAPTLTVATKLGLDSAGPGTAGAAIPSPPAPADLRDLGDILILAGSPTAHLLVLQVGQDGRVRFQLPRAEVGQGITTAMAMLVAEELDIPMEQVDVQLDDARPELLFNQLTGGSNTVRSLYGPVRQTAATVRARLVGTAAQQWNLPAQRLRTRDGTVVAPDGRSATFGELAAPAATAALPDLAVSPKPVSEFRLVGTPRPRRDARAMVTGEMHYTLDHDHASARPTMVRRPPTINGTVRSLDNEPQLRAMPGVIDVAVVPTGVAVMAETFGQAQDAKDAVRATWNPGTVDGESDETIRQKLRDTALPLGPALGDVVEGEFDFAFASHAPLESNAAIADVRRDGAEIWASLKSPITAQQTIARELGLAQDRVTVHVLQGGGSFGRRLFFDAALEAAQISRAMGKPVKLLWSRVDDMRHGRARAASFHRIRATLTGGRVSAFDHRVASVETDFRHGLGEILTATSASLPVGGNLSFAQTVFLTTVKSPYNFGVTTQLLNEVPLRMHTGSFRSVYSANTRGAEEILVDEIAARLGKDPVALRRESLKTERQRTVLDTVAAQGQWGRALPPGVAQGVGFHEEYLSCTACLVELDARDPREPRVTRATIVGDYGLPINPRGLEAQLLGGLTDAISTTLSAGLHIEDGLPLEGSYSQFHYARQRNSPRDVRITILPGDGEPGGAGELGLPAAVGAVANAYARATGTTPRSFPVDFGVDFEPFPR